MGSVTDLADESMQTQTVRVAAATARTRVPVLVLGAAALAAWIYLETTGEAGPGVVLFVGAFAVLAALVPGMRVMGSHSSARPSPDRPPLGERVEQAAAPGPAIWLLPFAVLPLMLLTLPLAYRHSPGDNSIVGLAFACALLGGSVGTVLGSRAWTVAMLIAARVTGRADGPIVPVVALRVSYAVAAVALVIAVIGSLFA